MKSVDPFAAKFMKLVRERELELAKGVASPDELEYDTSIDYENVEERA